MNDSRYERLRELSWRRKLTAEEQSELRTWLATHPEAEADWEAEVALSEALTRLPDAPVSSNFTARVLAEATREPARHRFAFSWRLLLPRVGVAAVAMAVSWFSYTEYQAGQRAALARHVAAVSEMPIPDPEVLRDFDAIRRLSQTPPADVELLALLK